MFQTAAKQRLQTTDIWANLYANAQSQAFAYLRQRTGTFPTMEQLDIETSRRMQGWNAINVNTMRAAAGQWLRAKTALAGLDTSMAPTGQMVFTPPWAVSGDILGVPPIQRLRARLRISPAGMPEAATYQWVTVFNEGEVPPLDSLLSGSQMQAIIQRYRIGTGLFGAQVNDVDIVDYELENV